MAGQIDFGRAVGALRPKDLTLEQRVQAALVEKLFGEAMQPGDKLDRYVEHQSGAMVSRLHRPGQPPRVHHIPLEELTGNNQHLIDAFKYGLGGALASTTTVAKPEDPLEKFTNAELVMEMLKRGFAVMKLPEDGGPPECLR